MRFRGFAAIVAVALSAAACTSSTAGSPTTSNSTTPTPTPTTSATTSSPAPTTSSPSIATTGPNVHPGEHPPRLSSVGLTHTNAGALTFAEFWFKTWDWAYATTDAQLMERYYARSCSDCALAAGQFSKVRAKGEHLEGGRLIFRSADLVPTDKRHGADLAVDVTIGQHVLRVVNASGKTVGRSPFLDHSTFRLWLKWTGHSWVIIYKAHVQ